MDADHVAPEAVQVVRRPSCPGVELVLAQPSPRVWGHFNSVFAFGSIGDWQGQLLYRRRTVSLASGDTFLFDPGEVFRATPREGRAGAFRVIEIMPEAFEAQCRAEGSRSPLHFAETVAKAAPLLAASLDALQAALLNAAEPLEQQYQLARVVHVALSTVLEHRLPSRTGAPPRGPCERLRDVLHSSEAARLNLLDFARAAEVSQYRLLREFKRRYGLPPHAYGLHVRVERARQMLRQGCSVAEAAAANDFADQSHLSRHFRRIWRVTPGQYVAGSLSRPIPIVKAAR